MPEAAITKWAAKIVLCADLNLGVESGAPQILDLWIKTWFGWAGRIRHR